MKRIRWARLGCVALAIACLALSRRPSELDRARQHAYVPDVEVTGGQVIPVLNPIIGVLNEPTLEIYDAQDLLSYSGDFPGDHGSGALTPAQLVAVIEAATQPVAPWSDGALEFHRGQLIVRQTAAGHAQVRAVLRALRAP